MARKLHLSTEAPCLLSIDAARRTGVAWGRITDAIPTTLVWPLDKKGAKDELDPIGARISAMDNTLSRFLDILEADGLKPRWCVMALPFASRNLDETESNFGLYGIVRAELWRRKVRLMRQPENTVRLETLGRGTAPTDEMKALVTVWCERQGIEIHDHNAGDAAVLWRWTRDELVRQRRLAA